VALHTERLCHLIILALRLPLIGISFSLNKLSHSFLDDMTKNLLRKRGEIFHLDEIGCTLFSEIKLH
jgi:hypothetical protein